MTRSRVAWAALFVVLAIALKITTFGDLNRHADETFYFLVGQRMHEGLLPYVDMWDRKPFGLFLIYYLIAGISTSVLAYQLVASLFAAATALTLAVLTARWSNDRGGLVAGTAYVFMVGLFEGNSGQAPDFYNLMLALAALLLVADWQRLGEGRPGGGFWAAMALSGLAITIKQTALFEAAYFGLFSLWLLWRGDGGTSRILRVALAAMALGAAPMAIIAVGYWLAGYWPEFWHAMVLSNLTKAQHDGAAWRLTGIVMRLLVILALATLGLASRRTVPPVRYFLLGWSVAAAIGMVSIRNFYGHYTLPLLSPLAMATGLFLARQAAWRPILVGFVLYATLWNRPTPPETRRESNGTIMAIANAVVRHDGGGGFLDYDAPPYLYALTGKRFLSPLVFPHHLNHAIERDVSHLATAAEIERVLAAGPGVIVMGRFPRNFPVNTYTRRRVLEYAHANCPMVREMPLREGPNTFAMMVFGDCRPGS